MLKYVFSLYLSKINTVLLDFKSGLDKFWEKKSEYFLREFRWQHLSKFVSFFFPLNMEKNFLVLFISNCLILVY